MRPHRSGGAGPRGAASLQPHRAGPLRGLPTGRTPPLAALLVAGLAAVGVVPGGASAQEDAAARGKVVYDAWCVECHGATGAGDGSAAASMLPRPRDFTQALYQIRTTGSGQLPTDDDIRAAIVDGLPGTTMPGWPNLSGGEVDDLVVYLKTFSRFFGQGEPPQALDFGSDPGGGAAALEAGAAAYLTLLCEECHGNAGRGDGTSAPTLEDWRGLPIRAADLTEAWMLNGGSSVEDMHTRILTGLDGTPMPSAIDAMNADVVSPDEVWQLAHYLASLGPREMPELRDVIRVGRAEGGLPAGGDAESWDGVEPFYFPLSGQIIETPRNFAPTVDGLWVQGLHDGSDVALRVQWNDPSQSPDPSWDEWQDKIVSALDLDGAEPLTTTAPAGDEAGDAGRDSDGGAGEPVRPPDAIFLQFPFEPVSGTERPYFLMGDARSPVYLWTWDSEDGVGAGRGRGLDSVEPLTEDPVRGEASWEDGRWTLYLRRPMEMESEGPDFAEGVPTPVAFQVWDGSSAEVGTRSAVSAWYYVLLEPPASSTVVVTPLLAMLLTGAFGLVLVRRAQDRRRT